MKNFAQVLLAGVSASMAMAMPADTSSSVAAARLPIVYGNGTHFQNLTAGRDLRPHASSASHNPLVTEIDCGSLPSFLTQDDCNYLSSIGVVGSGWGNTNIWVGSNGANVFHFHNEAGVPIILVFWTNSFVSANTPELTISIPTGGSVDVAFADNGQYGGFSTIYNHQNTLNNAGQIWNTWGEWSTGEYGTFDVSREVDMYGSWMKIVGNNGCNAEWNNNFSQCCFTCSTIENSQYNSCGDTKTYWLDNCYSNDPGAGSSDDLTSGGCTGWTSADVYLI